MSDSELEPAIDWSKDDNVLALGRKTDEDVLAKGWCDEKSAAFDSYRRKSTAYNHFNATIVRAARQGDVGTFFQYHYVCKFGRTSCKITQRRGTPTDKLLGLMKTCDLKHNINGELLPSQLQPPLIQTRYDPVHHRMLVAMRCVASNRPFLSTEDHFYKLELQHIHPGTQAPSRKRVSKDIKILEAFAHEHIRARIKLAITDIHCGTDELSGKFATG